jgi:hypothetical protein
VRVEGERRIEAGGHQAAERQQAPGPSLEPGNVFKPKRRCQEAEMSDKKKQKVKGSKLSRRGFLKGAAVAAGAAGIVGFPGVMRVSAQGPIKIKMQTAWDAGTVGFVEFQKFTKYVATSRRASW